MTDLTGKKIANTYKDLLQINSSASNEGVDGTLRRVQDGKGTNTAISLSTNKAKFHGNVEITGNLSVGTIALDGLEVSSLDAVIISATDIYSSNIYLNGDSVATSAVVASLSSTLETRIASVSAEVSAVKALVTAVNASAIAAIAANAAAIAANASAIGTANTNIAANTSIIAVLSTTLNTRINTVSAALVSTSGVLTTNINTVSAGLSIANVSIAANSAAIAANASAISVLQTSVAANTSLITELSATLETRIASVSAEVSAVRALVTAVNASAIAANTAAIAANTSAIAVANTSIAWNAMIINALGLNIEANTSSISVLADVSANTSLITALSATLEGRIATVSSTMATSIANHLPLAGGTLTGYLTLHDEPTADLHAATKLYVDNIASAAIHFHEAVRLEAPYELSATYNNGTDGVGATLTNAGTQAILVVDGVTAVAGDRILVYEQTDQTTNGVYVATTIGSPSTNWILTRSSDTDTAGEGSPDSLDTGSYFFVSEGDTGAGESYICNTPTSIVFGTTNITFVQFSSAIQYTAGTNINISNDRIISTSGVPTNADLAAVSATLATSIANVSATMATSIANVSATLESRIATVSSTMATSIATVSSTLESRIATVSSTLRPLIDANTSAIVVANASIAANTSLIAALSATLENRIATVSSTLQTSIAANASVIAATSATLNTRINEVEAASVAFAIALG
jgi:hypothetical protein